MHKETVRYMKLIRSELKVSAEKRKIDPLTLGLLEDNFNIYFTAKDQLVESTLIFTSDRGNLSPNPLLKILRDSMSDIFNVLDQLGISLKALQKSGGGKKEEEINPLDEFI